MPKSTRCRSTKPSNTRIERWKRQLIQVGKFMGVVIAVIVAIRIASWLATIVMIGGIAWVIYQIFLADRPKSK
jgi:hypothetical protein